MEPILKELEHVLANLPEGIRSGLLSDHIVERGQAQLALMQLQLAASLIPLVEQSDIATPSGSMRCFVNTASAVHADTVATWLIERAVSIGAPGAFSELTAYMAAESFSAREIIVLDGVSVDEKIELETDICLQPLASLQQTWFRDQFNADAPFQRRRNRASLVRTFSHPLIFRGTDSPMPKVLATVAEDLVLGDVARLFSLMNGVAPVVVARWWEHDLSIPARSPTTGAQSTTGFESSFHESRIGPSEAGQLKEWIRLYRATPSTLWSTLRVVLDRLNAAKRRQSHVDRSIELGIAAEALFLRYDGEDQSELSFRLATRAAWLLGTSRAERVKVFELFRAIYVVRSKAVHNGEVPSTVKEIDVADMLSRGCQALELAVAATLRRPSQDLRHVHLGDDSA